ncbi:MAG: putative O-glycosylation ligase, exosortase A system-associated [Bryobacterales bacterium]|nr:putative O-glycosylation ligase, exosortase A system-associated [Bryobacterales bacterium]
MRAIVFLILVAAICVAAILRPRIGLLGYIWFALMRPDFLAYMPDRYPFSIALAVCTLLGSLPLIPARIHRLFKNPFTVWLLLLQIPCVLSVLAANDRAGAWMAYSMFIRSLAVILLAAVLFESLEDLRRMLLVMAVSVGFIGAKFGLGGMVAGGVIYSQGYHGFMSDNNTLALSLAMGVQLCWYARRMVEKPWNKLAFLFLVFTNVATVVMTLSRGAALAMAAAFVKISAQSKRRILVLAGLLLLIIPSYLLIETQYTHRMSTLTDLSEDRSAMSRITLARLAIEVFKQRPVLGLGFGGKDFLQFQADNLPGTPHMVHNSYLQMLVDTGMFGFLLFSGLVAWAIFWLGLSARRMRKSHPGMEIYPYAIQMALIVYAITSLFYPRAYFDFFYMLIVAAGVWYMVVKTLASAPATAAPAPAIHTGLKPVAASPR